MTRRVLVVGLRATGVALAEYFARTGDIVTVVEEDPGQPGYNARAEAVRSLGAVLVELPGVDEWDNLVATSDLVVPSPGVRPEHSVYGAANRFGVEVRGELDLACELATVPVVAITGTNGKTTVTSLVTSMLVASGKRAVAAGNIGDPAIGVIDTAADVLVLEVSSFQLHSTTSTFRPRVAVLCNLADDHLDWHQSFDDYAESKARIFANQRDDDVLVANVDDSAVVRISQTAPARTLGFGRHASPGVAGVSDGALVSVDGTRLIEIADLPRSAPHDILNAGAAATAALEVGATRDGVRSVLTKPPRLHHRMESVGKAGGVAFVNDSKATNPHAALAALEGYGIGPERVVLIAGGVTKGLDLAPLRTAADKIRAVVAIGDSPEEVEATFSGLVSTVRAGSMSEAVGLAVDRALPGDTVLLSPACASFDWYHNYEARGDAFTDAVLAFAGSGLTNDEDTR